MATRRSPTRSASDTEPTGSHKTVQSFHEAWGDLEPAFRHCLELAYKSFVARGLPVGAVITDPGGSIVAEGRNRAYDPPGGNDALQETRLAHAEMNALAAIRTDSDLSGFTLWSTQFPCSMCRAAIDLSGIAAVRFMADDPAYGRSVPDGRTSFAGPEDTTWIVTANLLFVYHHLWVRGSDDEVVEPYLEREPEIASLVKELLRERVGLPVGRHVRPLAELLASEWDGVGRAAELRDAR